MQNRLAIFCAAALLMLVSGINAVCATEEFVAPFASWSNVQRDYGGGKVFGCQVNATGGVSGAERGRWRAGGRRGAERRFAALLAGRDDVEQLGAGIGGALRQAGKTASGQVPVFCGATGTSDGPYLVEKGGRLLVRRVYHEVSGDAPQAILLRDAGTLCIDATRFSYATRADKPLIALDGFRGDFTLLTGLLLPVGSEHTARVRIAGNGAACHALVMNNLFWETRYGINADHVWQNEATPPARAALLLNNMNFNVPQAVTPEKQSSGYGVLDNRGAADDKFIPRMLSPLREGRIWYPTENKPGITDLQMHRLFVVVGKGGRGIELRARK